MNEMDDSLIEQGSGNVFADLDRPEAEAQLLKADLVARIDAIVRERRLTQARAPGCSASRSRTSRGCCVAIAATIPSSACCGC